MKRKKVLVIPQASLSHNGGVFTHCVDLINLFLNDDKFDVELLPKIEVKRFFGKYIYNFKHLYKAIKESQSDIIHVHGFATYSPIQSLIIGIILKKKIVYSPHFHPFEYLNHPWMAKLYFYALIKPLLRFIGEIVTINNTDYSFFSKYHNKVSKIPHYLKPFNTQNNNVHKIENMILFVGRYETNKGVEYVEKLPNKFKLVAVSNKPLNRENTNLKRDISSDELISLYKSANLVVIPSRYEAFSYVALEALSLGTPVVMSNHVEIASWLNGINGFSVFAYGNQEDFIKKVNDTIGSQVSVEAVCKIFSAKKIKQLYEKVYK